MGSLVERIGECGRLLQVALDFTDLRDAVRVGSLTALGPAVILEAGTPLIKAEGMKAVDVLRSIPGRHLVMADTKTMDVGGLEARLAFEHGADAMSVLAASSEETIREAVREAEAAGRDVYADLMGFTDLGPWVEKARRAGAHVALIHIGIDVQRALGTTAAQAKDVVRRAKELFRGPVAVAGGIKPEDVAGVAEAGADIIIIGSAITKAADPASAARRALEGLRPRC
ncbi:MAG: orotidine 5'-phosphate decarboxylase / HUMPS family protein [Acidilobus sp.]|jgi:3-hexulose-6-phosphate synthase